MGWIYLKDALNGDNYHTQENNPTEELIKKLRKEDNSTKGYLYSCGASAAATTIKNLGYGKEYNIYAPSGRELPLDETIFDWFNNSNNYSLLRDARENISPEDYIGSTIPQYYPDMFWDLFKIKAEFNYSNGFFRKYAKDLLSKNIAIMACFKNPGHWITIKGIDIINSMIAYDDPWSRNYWPPELAGTSPITRRIGIEKFLANSAGFYVAIWGK